MSFIYPDFLAVCYPLIYFDHIFFSRSWNNLCRGKTIDLSEPRCTLSGFYLFSLLLSSTFIRVSDSVLLFTANSISTRDDFSPEETNLAPTVRYRLEFPQCTVDPVPAAKMERGNFICAYRDVAQIRNLGVEFHMRSSIWYAQLIPDIIANVTVMILLVQKYILISIEISWISPFLASFFNKFKLQAKLKAIWRSRWKLYNNIA